MTRMKLAHWPTPVRIGRGTILEAALAAGVPFPHSCMSGECGTCKCRLAAGEVVHDAYSPAALSDAELREGLILACRARPYGDVELAWATPQRPTVAFRVRRLRARVVHKSAATHDVTRLKLKVLDRPFVFAAGQFVRLAIDGLPPRSYSMANHPGQTLLEFHIRRVPGGMVSSYVADSLRAGTEVELEGPFGSAYWDASLRGPLLLVGGGTGLAPLKSVLAEALSAGHTPIHVYHGVRDKRDLYDFRSLTKLALHRRISYTPVLSTPTTPTSQRTGMVHRAVGNDFADLRGFRIQVAGPPFMVTAMRALALKLGAAPSDIAADAFHYVAAGEAGLLAHLRNWLSTRTLLLR